MADMVKIRGRNHYNDCAHDRTSDDMQGKPQKRNRHQQQNKALLPFVAGEEAGGFHPNGKGVLPMMPSSCSSTFPFFGIPIPEKQKNEASPKMRENPFLLQNTMDDPAQSTLRDSAGFLLIRMVALVETAN